MKVTTKLVEALVKKEPYFQCQECGKTLPETARKCSKCGSSDIDLYVPPKK